MGCEADQSAVTRRPRAAHALRESSADTVAHMHRRRCVRRRHQTMSPAALTRDESRRRISPIRQRDRGRADAALHRDRRRRRTCRTRGAGAGADAAFGDRSVGRGLRSRVSARRVGPDRAACRRPEVEQSTARRDDRHVRAAERQRRPCAPRDTRITPRRRIESERAAAREHDRVDLLDEIRRIEQICRRARTVAGHVGSSVFHLARIFKARTGFSLHAYRNQLRLRAALEQLRDPRVDLTSLALELGFSSHSHFTETFRRSFARTPSAVREFTSAISHPKSEI